MKEHSVLFVERGGGDKPRGKGFEKFMQRQSEVLDQMTQNGWELITAAPIIEQWVQGSRNAGIMLYFKREKVA